MRKVIHLEGSRLEAGSLSGLITTWSTMSVTQLRDAWRYRWRSPAPPVQSADILARMMAWRVQTETYGDIDRETLRRIDDLGRRLSDGKPLLPSTGEALPAGTVLTRAWRGQRHCVTAIEGGFIHEGKTYATLSEIARAITGTRWSGPRFFGLEAERQSKRRPAAGKQP